MGDRKSIMFDKEELSTLLSQIALKNESALDQLYGSMSSQLFGFILRIISRRDWAEEVLQETFINIWNKADLFRPDRGSALTWIINLARNKAIDWLRRNPNKIDLSAVALDECEHLMERDITGFDEQDSLQLEMLHKCIEELELSQRSVIMLAYFRGFTHADISKHTQNPLGTIKAWLRRGVDKLKRCLKL